MLVPTHPIKPLQTAIHAKKASECNLRNSAATLVLLAAPTWARIIPPWGIALHADCRFGQGTAKKPANHKVALSKEAIEIRLSILQGMEEIMS
jgi:hypothetical protein